ncbi:MAG: hypothetical protein O7B25_04225 [Gammaproteobacteria bacterium]|nr:hypothetical protein [Gammaproteobacteria bacterium]
MAKAVEVVPSLLAWVARVALSGVVCASLGHADASGPTQGQALFDRSELMVFELTAPFRHLIRDRYGQSTYNAAQLSYRDLDGGEVILPIEIRTRGKTRRRKDYCEFPPLRLRFGAGTTDTQFDGEKSLKLVTHCNDRDSFDQYVLQEYLAYRVYRQLTERSHRVRLAQVTYVESEGRVLTTRYGILLEGWKSVAERNNLVAAEVDGAVNIEKLSPTDANRVAVFQYMIGNGDWSVLWPEPKENCCHNTKPLLAPDGTVVPLPYDFDFAGIVNTPYAVSPDGSSNVRLRRYRGLCATQSQLSAILPLFRNNREAIYALYRDQSGMSPRRLRSALSYLDSFYKVINDPNQVERRMIRRCRSD